MAEIVNLNRVRKAKAKAEAERKADANRAVHGLTKAEKNRVRAEAEKTDRSAAAKKLDPSKPVAEKTDQSEPQ